MKFQTLREEARKFEAMAQCIFKLNVSVDSNRDGIGLVRSGS